MQNPARNLSANQTKGSTSMMCISAVVDITEAKTAKARMWPPRTMKRTAKFAPMSRPAKYPDMISPVVWGENPSSEERMPRSVENRPTAIRNIP